VVAESISASASTSLSLVPDAINELQNIYPTIGFKNDQLTVLGNDVILDASKHPTVPTKHRELCMTRHDLENLLDEQKKEINNISNQVFERRLKQPDEIRNLSLKLESINGTIRKIKVRFFRDEYQQFLNIII